MPLDSALLSSFRLRSHFLIMFVIWRVNSIVLICIVSASEKNEFLILYVCNDFKFFTVDTNKDMRLDHISHSVLIGGGRMLV